ncbi:subclass B3 metallo-beta-lactamase [Sphingopyxis solisilvae]|uniref:subclass B3 metallo-beta-lactamase n=1 Tax=Sphingopyxis solisilvae TaxID=1886788 RepID=UPI001892B748|nr:subclass B3 metallo-beta-lactamase [Sphingopyxis solisilvae]
MIAMMTVAAWLAGVQQMPLPIVEMPDAAMVAGGVSAAADDPLTRPIGGARATEWLTPVPPERLFGNSYLVGFAGLSVALIDTGDGLVLVDGALPQSAAAVLANVRALGFDPRDIKFILSTEPHWDHAGGLAALARDTGATVVASKRGAEGLRTGKHAADDPQLGYGGSWPAVTTPIRIMKDGEVLPLGTARITARATPGHTMGSMSWSWQACEGKTCKEIVFAASLNPVSADDYRFSSAAGAPFVAGFARSYRIMGRLKCDMLVTAHPDNAGDGRYNSAPGACSAYAERSRQALAKRLAAEKAGAAK